jgi:hypothetical protein
MTINYTTLLGLAKPVTGTESGAWGDVVNDQITSLVEDSIANAASISVTAGNVTLTDNNGTADQARMAILLVTGSPGVSRNIVAPSTSKWYIVKNSSNAEVVLKGSATTGVTIPAGAEVLAFWNGSDFEVTSMVGPSTSTDNAVARFDGTTGKVVQNSGVTIDDSNNVGGLANLNFSGTGNRVTGDFSNATVADRVAFQTSTVNSETSLGVIPNGTSPNSGVNIFNAANPTNAAFGGLLVGTTEFQIRSAITGSGTYLPMTFYTGGSERVRVDTSGNVGIGTSSPSGASGTVLEVNGGAGQARFVLKNNTTGSASTDGSQIALVNSQLVIQNRESSEITFETNGAERMRIDSSGNVGIGTSSPGEKFVVAGNASVDIYKLRGNTSAPSSTDAFIYRPADNTLGFGTASAERMRIDSSGVLMVGTSAVGDAARAHFYSTTITNSNVGVVRIQSAKDGDSADTALSIIKQANDTTTAQVFVRFLVNAGATPSGQINANGAAAAAFGSYSDVRLKENIIDLPPQLDNILALRPVEFDYKDGSGHQIGFIAQEMQQVYPDVVGVGRDEMLTVTGWDKTTSRLVKAIQEQQAIIEQLTQRIAALEGA